MDGLTFAAEGEDTVITFDGGTDGESVTIRLAPVREVTWNDRISTVVHQPVMEVELLMGGKALRGVGYCKRYTWTPAPQHWGYRFIQGFVDEGQTSIWTAEATFGLEKYDYFKVMDAAGDIQ